MMHTMCGVRCNVIRLQLVTQDVSGTGLYQFIRNTIKSAWLIKFPTCGKEDGMQPTSLMRPSSDWRIMTGECQFYMKDTVI